MLAKIELIRREENSAESLYEVILPHLAGAPLRDATRNVSNHGPFESVQRAGTCFFRCILTATRYVLSEVCGWSPIAVKHLFAAIRMTFLDLVAQHLRCVISRGLNSIVDTRVASTDEGLSDTAILRSRVQLELG